MFSNNEVVLPPRATTPTEINYITCHRPHYLHILNKWSPEEGQFRNSPIPLACDSPIPSLHLPQLWLAKLPKTILRNRHTSIHRITSVSTWPNSVILKMKAPHLQNIRTFNVALLGYDVAQHCRKGTLQAILLIHLQAWWKHGDSCFHQAWGWDQKYIPKHHIFPTMFRRIITQKRFISFIAEKSLDHISERLITMWFENPKDCSSFENMKI